MRECDVAVVGLGLIGSAALDALMCRQVDALGFDPLGPGAEMGSSHGSSRIFRRFNFENTNYTALSDEALRGWERLAAAVGETLLIPRPVLEAGPPGSALVAASRQAAQDKGLEVPLLTGREVNARFPAFGLPDDWEAVVHEGGAILLAQAALNALRARAEGAGRVVVEEIVGLKHYRDHVLLEVGSGETVRAKKVILTMGPWITRHLPELSPLLVVTRQPVGWFEPARPETVATERFPIFILARSDDDLVYGIPDFEGRGVKAAPHNHGPEVPPDAWGPPPTDEELRSTAVMLADFVPGAAGLVTDRAVCLYTNTRPADRRPDRGEEFIIDRWPDSNLVVGSACSGRGAKFAPAIGERLASLATDPDFRTEPAFRLSRYLAFPDDLDPAIEQAVRFYETHYDLVAQHMFERTDRQELGDRTRRRCRFCGKRPPEVTFRKEAHAIPEALGNRGLTSAYECDACNALFGTGIENDLGEWSKPWRTFARIKGKSGVPTLKKGSSGGWRIEVDGSTLEIKSYEDDPFYVVDEANKRVVFTFTRGAYTPVAVFKAFVKIGLTLMPQAEMAAFADALAWIRDTDHSASRTGMTIIHTFQNGPMPPDRLVAVILRRKAGLTNVPYAFLVLGYGNDVYQVPLPAPAQDAGLSKGSFQMLAFPTPGGPDPTLYGRSRPKAIDLNGTAVVRGEQVQVAMRYEASYDPSQGPPPAA